MGLNNPIKEQRVLEHVAVFVGLDSHFESVRVCVGDGEGTIVVGRAWGSGVLEVGAAIGPGRRVRRVGMESCCGAAEVEGMGRGNR